MTTCLHAFPHHGELNEHGELLNEEPEKDFLSEVAFVGYFVIATRTGTNIDVYMKCIWIATEATARVLVTRDPQVAAFRSKEPEEGNLRKIL